MLHYSAISVAVREVLDELGPRSADTGFSLAGGTSLALRFGHRMSMDLDFFTTGELAAESLLRQLELPLELVTDRAAGFLQLNIRGVKVEFLRHAYPLLAPPENSEGIRLWSLVDVAAMKLNAITNRGSKKDFFDLHELLRYQSLSRWLDDYCLKYAVANRFMVIRSLAWFEDAEREPDPMSLNHMTWTLVKKSIRQAVATLD